MAPAKPRWLLEGSPALLVRPSAGHCAISRKWMPTAPVPVPTNGSNLATSSWRFLRHQALYRLRFAQHLALRRAHRRRKPHSLRTPLWTRFARKPRPRRARARRPRGARPGFGAQFFARHAPAPGHRSRAARRAPAAPARRALHGPRSRGPAMAERCSRDLRRRWLHHPDEHTRTERLARTRDARRAARGGRRCRRLRASPGDPRRMLAAALAAHEEA